MQNVMCKLKLSLNCRSHRAGCIFHAAEIVVAEYDQQRRDRRRERRIRQHDAPRPSHPHAKPTPNAQRRVVHR